MALLDVIKYEGSGQPWLIYKCPRDNFKLGAQLIVNEGQEAIFFKGGAAQDVFTAGTHTLKSGNLPLLGKLVNMPFGGQTPFAAEVYFVNRTSKLDMRWGTTNAFMLEDPRYGIIVSIRSYGTYGIRISDARLFVNELIGALPKNTNLNQQIIANYFNGVLISTVKSEIASVMTKEKVSFLEVAAYLSELSQVCYKKLADEFDRFGVELVSFAVQSVTPPREDVEKLRRLKEEVALGKDFYAQRRSFDIMERMVSNPGASGLANAGIGLGMGLGAVQGVAHTTAEMFGSLSDNINGQTVKASESRKCTACGAAIPEGQKFCGECGTPTGIVCSKCGSINADSQKFCGECGARLANVCSSCGTENPSGQKFCGNCGSKL